MQVDIDVDGFFFLSNSIRCFSRFIINIPAEQRDDAVRVLFAVEQAHWHYIDYHCSEDDQLPECNMKDFAQQSRRIEWKENG